MADIQLAKMTDVQVKSDITYVDGELAKKVDKVAGKQLSTEDYTSTEKTKLAGIADAANNITNVSELENDLGFIDGTYDNTTSGLTATTIKEAIDELKALIDAITV